MAREVVVVDGHHSWIEAAPRKEEVEEAVVLSARRPSSLEVIAAH